MRLLTRTVLLWGVIEVLAVNLSSQWIGPEAIYPVSWLVYSLAGREAARRGKTWHGAVAGGAVAAIENLVWFAGGAPGHADTSDLPVVIAALTFIAVALGMVAIGAFFGTLGAAFGHWGKSRAARLSRPTAGQ